MPEHFSLQIEELCRLIDNIENRLTERLESEGIAGIVERTILMNRAEQQSERFGQEGMPVTDEFLQPESLSIPLPLFWIFQPNSIW